MEKAFALTHIVVMLVMTSYHAAGHSDRATALQGTVNKHRIQFSVIAVKTKSIDYASMILFLIIKYTSTYLKKKLCAGRMAQWMKATC